MQRRSQGRQRYAENGGIQANYQDSQDERTERLPSAISEIRHHTNLLSNSLVVLLTNYLVSIKNKSTHHRSWFSTSGLVVRWIDHHPSNNEGHNILPCVSERCRRRQILFCEEYLVQRDGREIGPAHLLSYRKLDDRIYIR